LYTAFFISCSKKTSLDQAPDSNISATLLFNPEYSGTWSTNQADSNCNGYGKFVVTDAGNDSAIAKAYIDIDGSFLFTGTAPYTNKDLKYDVIICTPKFKKGALQPGTLNWSASTVDVTTSETLATIGVYIFNQLHPSAWSTIKASSSINFSSYPDSYIKFTFARVFTKRLEDGIHTYADGSFDITLLGGSGNPNGGGAIFYGQAHLSGSFSSVELENYE
jgi:hypothetical protein